MIAATASKSLYFMTIGFQNCLRFIDEVIFKKVSFNVFLRTHGYLIH
jgi:hypothetical protein